MITLNSVRTIVFSLLFTTLLSGGISLSLRKSAIAVTDNSQIVQKLDRQDTMFVDQLPKKITRKVLRDASKRSGLPTRRLKIKNVTSKTFGNPCIFKFGEICTREFNPIEGWETIVQIKEKFVTYHVDRTGAQIVVDPNANFKVSTKLPENIAIAVLQDASRHSGVAVKDLKIQKATSKTFVNPCTFNFGEVCTQEFNPVEGWKVIVKFPVTYRIDRGTSQVSQPCKHNSGKVCDREVEVKFKGQSVIYHVNLNASQIVVDPNAKSSLYGSE